MNSHQRHGRDGGAKKNNRQDHLQLATKELSVQLIPNAGSLSRSHSLHQRAESLHVNWTETEIIRLVKEVHNETIAEVHLSLLGYWIRESDEHYKMAKQHIRELALDQGYNIERIQNMHLRRLLKDVHEVRPNTSLRFDPAPKASHKQNIDMVRNFMRSSTDTPFFREPPHSAAMKRHKSMKIAKQSPSNNVNSSSPTTLSSQHLSESIKSGKKNILQEDLRPFNIPDLASPTKEYPPNTPDRPAPLSFRSFSSKTTVSLPTTANSGRSVSSPFSDKFALDPSSPLLPRNSILIEDTASHPLLSPSKLTSVNNSNRKNTDDVFGIVNETSVPSSGHSSNIHVHKNSGYDTNGGHISRGPGNGHLVDMYKTDAIDAESDGSYETIEDSDSQQSHEGTEGELSEIEAPMGDRFEDMDSLDASGDEISVLETASNVSDDAAQTRYVFTSRQDITQATLTSPQMASTSRNYFSDQQLLLEPNSTSFARPLPLRDYEEKQDKHGGVNTQRSSNEEPTARKQEPIPLPPSSTLFPTPSARLNNQIGMGSGYCSSTQSPTNDTLSDSERTRDVKTPSKSPQTNKQSTTPSTSSQRMTSSTLIAFPIPPMQSPLAELPMAIMRATSTSTSSSSSSPPNNNNNNNLEPLANIAHITYLLRRTREQAAHLPLVNFEALNLFERIWRDANETLLVSVFGRKDVALCEMEVRCVEWIAREMRDSDDAEGEGWREMFMGTD